VTASEAPPTIPPWCVLLCAGLRAPSLPPFEPLPFVLCKSRFHLFELTMTSAESAAPKAMTHRMIVDMLSEAITIPCCRFG
jgi:hypothetical protein